MAIKKAESRTARGPGGSSRGPKTLREVSLALRGGANVVPLVREVPADTLTPVAAFLRLAGGKEAAFLLESVEGGERLARYSFIGVGPFETLTVEGSAARSKDSRGGESVLPGNPFLALGERLKRFRAVREPGLPRFCGGAVGTVGYEMIRHLEPKVALNSPEGPEAELRLFKNVAAFDHVRHRVLLIANVIQDGATPLGRAYREACGALDEMEERLSRPGAGYPPLALSAGDANHGRGGEISAAPGSKKSPGTAREENGFRAAMGRERFMEGVERLKAHIRAGDIFQGVLSDRFETDLRARPFSVYRALRAVNPSPYMFFIGTSEEAALGASPEMLVRVEDGVVETRPIAGTRPRGATEEEDRRLEKNLLGSVKEKAEHVMLVDLGRNDVGRVARPGTVRVPSYMQVERYSHVMHLVSSVRGELVRGVSPWEAFAACFPAGTVTGAPKIRAMQLIAGLEPVPRGLYAGAVVYCDFHGNLDSAIAIRSLSIRRAKSGGRVARFQAGAGIVADSRPDREYEEVLNKSRALREAIRLAEDSAGRR